MKRIIFSAALVLSLALAACGNENNQSEGTDKENVNEVKDTNQAKSNKDEVTEEETGANQDNYVDEDQPLTKVGQWKKSEYGSIITLKAIFEPVNIYKTELFNLNIDSVKLLEYTDIQSGDKDLLLANKNSALTLQIAYTFENNSDKAVEFSPVYTVTTDTKKQYNFDYLIGGGNVFEFKPNVKVEDYVIFLMEDEFKDLNSFTLYSGSLFTDDPYTLHEEEITHTFKVTH